MMIFHDKQTAFIQSPHLSKDRTFPITTMLPQFLEERLDINCSTLTDDMAEHTDTMKIQFDNYFFYVESTCFQL